MVVYSSWKFWLASLAVSLGLFAIVYFAVIKPANDTANDAITTGLQQSQQALDQSQQQLDQADQGAQANKQAQQQLSQADQLLQCMQDAGTDTSAIQTCQEKYQP